MKTWNSLAGDGAAIVAGLDQGRSAFVDAMVNDKAALCGFVKLSQKVDGFISGELKVDDFHGEELRIALAMGRFRMVEILSQITRAIADMESNK